MVPVAGTALVNLALCGCANFWDEVTSRDFQMKNLYAHDNPLEVIRDSNDGDRRARALRALREPKQAGGTDAEQDVVVNVLVTSARSDSQPLCRLAAINSLGHFQDPRAVQGLIDAYFAVAEQPKQKNPNRLDTLASSGNAISADTATVIQVEALTALGRTKQPPALELLTRIARPEPASAIEVSEQEKRNILDVKIAAVRALGNYSQYQSTEALLLVLQKERDVALRDRAVESLQAATGKKFGDDAGAWEEVLHSAGKDNDAVAGSDKRDPKVKQASGGR